MRRPRFVYAVTASVLVLSISLPLAVGVHGAAARTAKRHRAPRTASTASTAPTRPQSTVTSAHGSAPPPRDGVLPRRHEQRDRRHALARRARGAHRSVSVRRARPAPPRRAR